MLIASGTDVTIEHGDTALLTLHIRAAYKFAESDRAVFTISTPGGRVIGRCTRPITESGWVQVPLVREDTLQWRPGRYNWDLRVWTNATLDEGNNATGGRELITPMIRHGRFTIREEVSDL